MSVRMSASGNWTYRFSAAKRPFSGVCYGCKTYEEAMRYEDRMRHNAARLCEQKKLSDMYNNCRDMIIDKNPIYLDRAFKLAMEKPRRRQSGEEREETRRRYWMDFVYYVKHVYPDATCLQRVTTQIAEAYISVIRRYGDYTSYITGKSAGLYSNFTLNEIHSVCQQVFELLKKDAGMDENPFKDIPKLPHDSDSHEPFTWDELGRIFRHTPEELYPIFFVGLFSGLRLGDICKLRKTDIHFDRHIIVRSMDKTKYDATIPMHEKLEEYLTAECAKHPESEFVFPELAAQHIKCPSTICNKVRRFLEETLHIETMKKIPGRRKAVNIKGVHSLRHTFCTIAGIAGIPETVVRSIVGHMTPKMIRLYTQHVDDQEKLRCIELFGQKLANIPELPREPLALPLPDTEYEAKWQRAMTIPNPRVYLRAMVEELSQDEARKMIIEMWDRQKQL